MLVIVLVLQCLILIFLSYDSSIMISKDGYMMLFLLHQVVAVILALNKNDNGGSKADLFAEEHFTEVPPNLA